MGIELLFSDFDAPVGTSEYLISFTCESLAEENCLFLCLGAITGTQLGEIIGLSYFGKALVTLIFKIARCIFKLEAKAFYFKKYQPYLRSIFSAM